MTGISYTPNGADVHPRGAWAANTAYAVNDQVTEAGAVWNCTTAHTSGATFTGTDWELVGGTASLTQTITTSQNVTAPVWATIANVTLIGGGGGGGGGGSSTTASKQSGGAGAAAGTVLKTTVSVVGLSVLTVTIGAAGTGGIGGSAGSGGASGTTGGSTSLSGSGVNLSVAGGMNGSGGPANNTGSVEAGVYAYPYTDSGTAFPTPGSGSQGFGFGAVPLPEGPCGGSYGGNGNATNGSLPAPPITEYGQYLPDGGNNNSTTANGGNAANATLAGCGGIGGGASGNNGTGGNGGNGAPGVCIIEWRSQ